MNEALNTVRPYGKMGEPMPWSVRPRKNFFPFASEHDLEKVLTSVKKSILEWASIRAGQISHNIVVKQQSEEGGNSPTKLEGAHEDGIAEADQPSHPNKKNEAALIRQTAFK